MTFDPELEGLWRIETEISNGLAHTRAPWHYLFRNGLHKEIVPDLVDDGTLRSSYKTNVKTNPCQLEIKLDYNGPDGPPDPNPIILRGVYEVDGETLRITYGVEDEFPTGISDTFPYSIKTLVRDLGPTPKSKQSSDTPPIIDEVLGQLNWDDNLDEYEGAIQIENRQIQISLIPDEKSNCQQVLKRARTIFTHFKHYVGLIEQYACDGLLEIKNDSWLNNQLPLSRKQFINCMVLKSITFYPNGVVIFWHDDGGLFCGHSIQVSIDSKDNCTLTDIPG